MATEKHYKAYRQSALAKMKDILHKFTITKKENNDGMFKYRTTPNGYYQN